LEFLFHKIQMMEFSIYHLTFSNFQSFPFRRDYVEAS
jgi:alpha-N-acetylglucosamine transferase